LADDERIRWGRNDALSHKWLEIIDGSADQIDIVTPSSHDRIRLDYFVTFALEERQEGLTSFLH
jgi:hypothetical protein